MAASLIGIMALVWVNMSSKTAASHHTPASHHKPSDTTKATVAHKRSQRTRSPVRSLSMPQP